MRTVRFPQIIEDSTGSATELSCLLATVSFDPSRSVGLNALVRDNPLLSIISREKVEARNRDQLWVTEPLRTVQVCGWMGKRLRQAMTDKSREFMFQRLDGPEVGIVGFFSVLQKASPVKRLEGVLSKDGKRIVEIRCDSKLSPTSAAELLKSHGRRLRALLARNIHCLLLSDEYIDICRADGGWYRESWDTKSTRVALQSLSADATSAQTYLVPPSYRCGKVEEKTPVQHIPERVWYEVEVLLGDKKS